MLINNIRKSPTCPIRNTIHAPTRGATKDTAAYKIREGFQSTLLQEERRSGKITVIHIIRISIHAPTRGATFSHLLS